MPPKSTKKPRTSGRSNKGQPPARYLDDNMQPANAENHTPPLEVAMQSTPHKTTDPPPPSPPMSPSSSERETTTILVTENNNLRDLKGMLEDVIKRLGSSVDCESKYTVDNKNNLPPPLQDDPFDKGDRITQSSTNAEIVHQPFRKLYDLPIFTGVPEEWPTFIASFEQTTATFGYTNLENQLRLQKGVQGIARRTIEAMLISPTSVPDAINELKFRFGRPETLVRSQMDKMQRLPSIKDDDMLQLIEFSTQVRGMVAFITAAKCEQYLANPILLDELVGKLPLQRRMEWATQLVTMNQNPTLLEFSSWLGHVARLAALIEQTCKPPTTSGNVKTGSQGTGKRNDRKYALHAQDVTARCSYCGGEHQIVNCPQFTALATDQRWQWVKNKNVCFGCLNRGHRINGCRRPLVCGIYGCERKHSRLLHDYKPPPSSSNQAQVLSLHRHTEEVYYRIIPVTLTGRNGATVKTFAMLDEGSSTSMMERSLAAELQLTGRPDRITIQWFDERRVTETAMIVDCEVQGRGPNYQKLPLKNVYAIERLSLPCQTMPDELTRQYPQLQRLPIPKYVNAKPRVLIGLDNARLGYASEWVDCPPYGPTAVHTRLGWLVYGQKNNGRSKAISQPKRIMLIQSAAHEELERKYTELDQTMRDFYETESMGVKKTESILKSPEIVRAEKLLYENTHKSGNRYECGLLWKAAEIVMPDSFPMALKRLNNTENKMSRDPEYANKYKTAIADLVAKQYARKLSNEESNATSSRTWYLPHFGVINPNKPEKFRLVFDAAATVNGISLNSLLLKGPDLNRPLMSVLSQLREKTIAVCADIREMFLRVKIKIVDRQSLRFLWRDGNVHEPVEVYEMESLIFGATCAPAIAQYVKNINAEQYYAEYPEAAEAVIKSHYVDDFVKSFPDEDTAIRVSKQVRDIQAAAGFELRRFISNSKNVKSILNSNAEASDTLIDMNVDAKPDSEKILGMYWNSDTDEFLFELRMHKVPRDVIMQKRPPSKREMLSVAMSVYDPMGFIANFHIVVKILLQSTWETKLEWDQPIPEQIIELWYQWQNALKTVTGLRIPRCYSINLFQADDLQLHIFVDASENAYAAVSYWRIVVPGYVEVKFVYGKTRVAPRKQLSIPRLELQAAVLGTRMYQSIIENHSIVPMNKYYWSDSKTVLHWVKSNSRKYKPFVAHRIAEILESSNEREWKYVPTKLNAADDATRIKQPLKYESENRWINGPAFLRQEESQWPQQPPDLRESEITSELKYYNHQILTVVYVNRPELPDANRFSKYTKLQRATAWLIRAQNNLLSKIGKRSMLHGELTAAELTAAEIANCRQAQRESYPDEWVMLSDGKSVPPKSELYKLSPYMHEDGLIRVNGRIDAASAVPYSSRRPIIMPKNHKVSELIIEHQHRKMLHQNDETVVCQIRQKFWIPHLRTKLRIVKANCQWCKVRFAKPSQPMMGPLPYDRLAAFARPFTYTGLDYFGPITVSIGRRREKRWVALFTCLTTRAVHLELATNLSTDACILCIRNFVNLRGVPKRIRSDNGTNFVGLKSELQNVPNFLNTDEIQRKFTDFGIEWIFNSPADPSAGGSWERLVQSIKRSLNVALGDVIPKEDTLRSMLLEAANIVNSRPLTHIPITPDDENPLTPNHFLIGEMNSTLTTSPDDSRALCSRKQWKIAQELRNRFYRRWIAEYLPLLTRRCKYFEKVPPLKTNDYVLVCDSNLPPSRWLRGRIIEVYPGKDGQTRTATIETATGRIKRPVSKLAVLDIVVNRCGRFTGEGMSTSQPC